MPVGPARPHCRERNTTWAWLSLPGHVAAAPVYGAGLECNSAMADELVDRPGLTCAPPAVITTSTISTPVIQSIFIRLPRPRFPQALGRKVREFNAGLAAEAQLSEAELAPGGEPGAGAGVC